jgi:hypothetical protein
MTNTERERQYQLATERGGKLFVYACDDGEFFDAIAHTEAGAFRVLNADRPWMRANLSSTHALCDVCGRPTSANPCRPRCNCG